MISHDSGRIAVTLKWSRPPVNAEMIPGARDGHSACVINNKMYIFGGYEEAVSDQQTDRRWSVWFHVIVYRVALGSWLQARHSVIEALNHTQ